MRPRHERTVPSNGHYSHPCVAGHRRCSGYTGGPCSKKITNSNPTTKARQKRRKK